MTARIIRQCDLSRVPWKNGGGTTCEIAASPSGAGLDAFEWRLSMADVGTDGPFSTFPGIDRTLVLIEGRGVELTIEGAPHRLDAASPMLRFSGESFTTARLIDGPIRDLNVMTRRGRFTHEVKLMAAATASLSPEPGEILACVMLGGPTRVDIGSECRVLDRLDVLIGPPGPVPIRADGPAVWIRLSRTGSLPVR